MSSSTKCCLVSRRRYPKIISNNIQKISTVETLTMILSGLFWIITSNNKPNNAIKPWTPHKDSNVSSNKQSQLQKTATPECKEIKQAQGTSKEIKTNRLLYFLNSESHGKIFILSDQCDGSKNHKNTNYSMPYSALYSHINNIQMISVDAATSMGQYGRHV